MLRPPFTALADVYDAIMADIEYEEWCEFILRTARERGWAGGACLDLGCGTGNATFPLFARGLEVVGLDASESMLRVAREKLPPVRFERGDFVSFALGRRFTLVYSVFDSLNNLLEPAGLLRCARRVLEHLEPGGLFLFDVNTRVGLRDLWESGRAEGWADDVYYRWDHRFDVASGLAQVEAYCERGAESFLEVHHERPYDEAELRPLLAEAGFADVEALVFPSGEPAEPDAARLWVVARRPPGPG